MLGDPGHDEILESLKLMAATIKKPSAVLVICAHWEEEGVTIIHRADPPMIYDYRGFPKEAYEIEYSAPGAPELAEQVHGLFQASDFESILDDQRGFDHGLYVPLKIMYPEADVPCIQVSLKNSLDASEHIRIGQTLSGLTHEGLLIIGSGSSFHNVRALRPPDIAIRERNIYCHCTSAMGRPKKRAVHILNCRSPARKRAFTSGR